MKSTVSQSLPSAPSTSTAVPRRQFLQMLGTGAAGLALSGCVSVNTGGVASSAPAPLPPPGPKQLRGLFPIGQTPFTPDDKLDLESLAAEVTFCNRGGVHGFIWPQIASGWTSLTEPERLSGAEAILAAGKGGRTSLVIGVQAKDIAAVTRYAKHAAEHGADAIVSLPPAGVTDEKVLLDYYQQVGRMTDLPLFVQSQGSMSIDLIIEIYKTMPTVRQVKDEAGNPLERVAEIRRRSNDELKVFSGQGVRTMINEMELGFSGHCPTTGLADVYAAAFDLWHAGRRQEAFDMFGRICAFTTLGSSNQNSVLVARGVFKPTVHSRPTPGMGGGGGGGGGGGRSGPAMDDQAVRAALDGYLKPYLRA